MAEDVVKPLVKPIGDAVKKVVEDPEGYGLTRPFTPKVHVPPSTVGKRLEEEKNGGGSDFKGSVVSGSGENWGKDTNAVNNGWASVSGDFGSDSDETNNGWASEDWGSGGWSGASGSF